VTKAELASSTQHHYSGIITPLLLPLNPSWNIDFASFERLIEWQLSAGINGLWINGTSGVFFQLDRGERAEVAQFVIRTVSGRVPVIVNAGASGTRLAIRHARDAAEIGADAIAAIPPFYMNHSQEMLKQHYRALFHEAKIPLFLYNVPQHTRNPLTIASILELASEGILFGLKESAGSMDFQADLLRESMEAGLPLRVFNGTSIRLEEGFRLGACGFMGAICNLMPIQCRLGYEAALAQKWQELAEICKPVRAVMRILSGLSGVSFDVFMKCLLKEMGVIESSEVFRPDFPVTEDKVKDIRKIALPLVINHS
jgi:4-hydroxy-tetrahydrodipicolinate synthase